jgi:oligosaccharyltransferase complex subunit alpha (ribophorin I)
VTYLDTAGRPVLTFQYKDLTVKHAETILVRILMNYIISCLADRLMIKVSYKVSMSSHLIKPIAVATAFFSLFTLCMFARRVDLTLHQKKLKKL